MRPPYKKRQAPCTSKSPNKRIVRSSQKQVNVNVNNNSSSTLNNAGSTTKSSVALGNIFVDEAKLNEIVKEIEELKKEVCDKTNNLKNVEKINRKEYNNLLRKYNNKCKTPFVRQKIDWENLHGELVHKQEISEENLKQRQNQLEQINKNIISCNNAVIFHEMKIKELNAVCKDHETDVHSHQFKKKYYDQCLIENSIESEMLGEKISCLEDTIAKLNKDIPKLQAVKKELVAELARVEYNEISILNSDLSESDNIIKKTEEEFGKNL